MIREHRDTHEPEELCDAAGASKLKARIEAYWAARGLAVEVQLRAAGFHPAIRSARVDLRSNMRNGFPAPAALPSSLKDAA